MIIILKNMSVITMTDLLQDELLLRSLSLTEEQEVTEICRQKESLDDSSVQYRLTNECLSCRRTSNTIVAKFNVTQ